MRRFCAGFSLVLIALFATFNSIPVHAQDGVVPTEEPKPVGAEEKQGAADQWMADTLALIQQRQADYFSTHGQYFQGLQTHSVVVDYSTTKPDASAFPDTLDIKPSDQTEDWLTILPELQNSKMPAVMTIDTYDGPNGKGYQITLHQCIEKQCYRRVINSGPEEWRSTEWLPVEDAIQ